MSFLNEEQFVGTSKAHDPTGLVHQAAVRSLTSGMANVASAERRRLLDIISVTPAPLPSVKVVQGTFRRLSTLVGEALVEFGTRNHKDEQELERSRRREDPHGIRTEQAVAQVHLTASSPTTPIPGVSGVKLVAKDRQALTQGITSAMSVSTWSFGPRDSKDDLELDRTRFRVDPHKLQSAGTIALLHATSATSTPPSVAYPEMQYVGTEVVPITSGTSTPLSLSVHTYGTRTSAQEVTFDASRVEIDPAGIESTAALATISSATSLPTTSALKPIATLTRQITPSRTVEVVRKGFNDAADQIKHGGSFFRIGGEMGDRAYRALEIFSCSASATLLQLGEARYTSAAGTYASATSFTYPFRTLETKKLHDRKGVHVLEYSERPASGKAIGPGKSKAWGRGYRYEAWRSAKNTGTVQAPVWKVKVADHKSKQGTTYDVLFARTLVCGARAEFHGGFLHVGASLPAVLLASTGKVNDASFAGFPQYTVMYVSFDFQKLYDHPTDPNKDEWWVTANFLFDSNGHIIEQTELSKVLWQMADPSGSFDAEHYVPESMAGLTTKICGAAEAIDLGSFDPTTM